jgi:hypothetical protein
VSLLPFCEWLATTEWSIALHESLFVYPLVETTHVLSLILFVGTVSFVDLRLLGLVFRDVPISQVTARLLPWTIVGFFLIGVSGVLLFYAIPVRTYSSVFFRVKLIMLVVAGINAGLFHLRVKREGPDWDSAAKPPFRVRMTGAVSLFSWATVIVMGRMIAYNWFDCDNQPQTALINWAAGCVVGQ